MNEPEKQPEPVTLQRVEKGGIQDKIPAYHPLAAILMVALDFSGTLGDIQGFMWLFAMPLAILTIFTVTTALVSVIQNRVGGDDWKQSLGKGVIAGSLCAVPMPVFGTAVGGYVLFRNGIDRFQSGGVGKMLEMFLPREKSSKE